MSLLPHYIHIVNPRLKHIYLTFNDEGNLVIKSPAISQKHIEKLLLKKASWINKSQEKFLHKKGRPLDFSQNSKLYFLGDPYPLNLIKYEKKRIKFTFDGTVFTLFYHNYDTKLFQKYIDRFYKREVELYTLSLVEKWSKKMNLKTNKISFRKTKRQWGSCSAKNDLSFNTMIMKLPLAVIQYIVIHELAHIKHKHHQKAFWDLVKQYLPDYKKHTKELKNYTT